MDNHLRRVLILFGLGLLSYMKNLNVMMHLRSSQWKICSLCLHAAKKSQKTSRAPSQSKKCKQRMTYCLPTHIDMAEAAEQQATICKDAQDWWRPSDESTSVSHDSHHLCLMAKKNKKKSNKKDQEKEKAQVDDQDKSDVEVEDNYNLDHLNRKDKFIIMKIVEKNDELEEEIEKQEQSL